MDKTLLFIETKKLQEILLPYLEEAKKEVMMELLEAKTAEALWQIKGKLDLLTKIEKKVNYIITKYEKEMEKKK